MHSPWLRSRFSLLLVPALLSCLSHREANRTDDRPGVRAPQTAAESSSSRSTPVQANGSETEHIDLSAGGAVLGPYELIALLPTLEEHAAWKTRERAGHRRCAAFDADGTLWREDLPEAVIGRAVSDAQIRPQALTPFNELLERFGKPRAASAHDAWTQLSWGYTSGTLHKEGAARGLSIEQVDREFWGSYNVVFAGWEPESLMTHTRKVMDSGFGGQIFAGMRDLLAALRRRGFRTVVVSAGLDLPVRVAASYLGFAPEEVRGNRSKLRNGILTHEAEPPHVVGPGKSAVAKELCGGTPLLAFGDSVATSDRQMLDDALVAVAVEPKQKHLLRAQEAGMFILDFQRTEDGHPADRFVKP